MDKTPDNIRDSSDVGDQIQRRFRYQAVYAAVIAIELLKENSELEKVYCEHHDDILVRRKDGKFIAIQVKTREQGRDALKSTDEEVKKSILKFMKLNSKYGNQFSKFVIVSSVGFWKNKKNQRNLDYLRELALEYSKIDIPRQEIRNYHNNLMKHKKRADMTEELDFNEKDVELVLARLELQTASAIEDIEMRLQLIIGSLDYFKERTILEVKKATEALIERTSKAGALSHEFKERDIYKLFKEPKEFEDGVAIKGKLITSQIVEEIIKSAFVDRIVLKGGNYITPDELPKEMRVGRKKMAAGQVKLGNISLINNQKNAAEHLLVKWFHRYEAKDAQDKYKQVALIVHTECAESFSETYNKEIPFGERMLKNVRKRIRTRYREERDLFFNCRYEHLMGFVGILTEDCTIWWSDCFDLVVKEQ